jgi:hypothetical protein
MSDPECKEGSDWLFVLIVIVAFLALGGVISLVFQGTGEKIITVHSKFDTYERSGYYIVSDTYGETYKIYDEKLYNGFVEGSTYMIYYRGLAHPEITEALQTQTVDLSTNTCYLRGVANGS